MSWIWVGSLEIASVHRVTRKSSQKSQQDLGPQSSKNFKKSFGRASGNGVQAFHTIKGKALLFFFSNICHDLLEKQMTDKGNQTTLTAQ